MQICSYFCRYFESYKNMSKKGNKIKWDNEAKKSFDDIKTTLSQAPLLTIPDFSKQFIIFSFAFEHTIFGVLLPKNVEVHEQPISFFIRSLRYVELKYDIMDKQAYALIKSLKYFRVFVLHSHITSYVLDFVIRSILIQPSSDGRRGKWIAKVLEFDLEIMPTKPIKGKALARLMTKTNLGSFGINLIMELSGITGVETVVAMDDRFKYSSWYGDIVYFLQKI